MRYETAGFVAKKRGKKGLIGQDKWAAYGVFFHFLPPPYSPELNLIEIPWGKIKYEWLPLESYQHHEH